MFTLSKIYVFILCIFPIYSRDYCLLALWHEARVQGLLKEAQTEVQPMGDEEEVTNHQTRSKDPLNPFASHKLFYVVVMLPSSLII